MQLQPGNSFTVVRQIANHLDTDTNYVKAVIRNAYTDAVITTLNLTDKGSQRFSKNWQVSADPSGQGFYISIVTSVYTDSGYTTKNPNYGDEENTYLIADRLTQRGGGGGLDAYTVRRIVQEELDKHAPDYSPITGALGAVQREINRIPKDDTDRTDEILNAIRSIKFPDPDKIDLAPVKESIDTLTQTVQSMEPTPETDLSPVMDLLDALKADIENRMTENATQTGEQNDKLRTEVMSELEKFFTGASFNIPLQMKGPEKAKPQETPPLDIRKLAV